MVLFAVLNVSVDRDTAKNATAMPAGLVPPAFELREKSHFGKASFGLLEMPIVTTVSSIALSYTVLETT